MALFCLCAFCCIMNYDVTLYTLHYTGDSRSVNEDQMLCDDNNVVDDVILCHDNDVTMVTDDDDEDTDDTKKT